MYRPFGGMLPVKSRISREPNLLNDASVDVSGGMLMQAATVLPLGAKSRLRERMVLDVAELTRAAVEAVGKEGQWRGRSATCKMMCLVAATLGPSGGVAVGRIHSGGFGVALPGASAKRLRLLPEVFDYCSYVGCRAIIRELNETVLLL